MSFGGASYIHPASAAGNCNSCHLTGSGGAMTMVSSHAPINRAQCDACHTSTATGGFAIYTMGTTGHTAAGVTSTSAGLHSLPCGELFRCRNQAVDPRCDQLELLDFWLPQQLHKLCGSDLHPSGHGHELQPCHIAGNTVGAMVEVSIHVPTGTVLCSACHTSQLIGGFASYTLASVHSALNITTGSTNCATAMRRATSASR